MDWQGVAYGLACCLIREIKHLVAYGLACCLIHEIMRLVAYGLACCFDAQKHKHFGCVWIGKALRVDWHAV